MGITGLWAHLKGEGRNCVQTLEGKELVRHVDGQVVAIDASTWLVQAATEKSYDHDLKHFKTVFERVCHFLRLGVLPVLVFDGVPPPEKAATFMRRYRYPLKSSAACGGVDSAFRRMVTDTKELLAAMGLPAVQAPGEAEATCALLNRLGMVDAVASEDGDALLYGARRLYKGLRLHTELHQKHHTVEWVEQAAVAAALGLEGCGAQMEEAMVAVALTSGADYLDGIKSHGPATSAEVVQALLRRQQRRRAEQEEQEEEEEEEEEGGAASGLLDLLREALATPVDEALLASNSRCSTCRRCRHGPTGKPEHGKHGCEECGTHPLSKGGSDEGGCLPLASPDEPCPCGPCSRRDDRLLHGLAKAAAGAQTGGIRAFLQRYDAAREAYKKTREDETVLRALPPFKWERINYGELKRQLHRVYGRSENVARKILPLLLEYDARYVGKAVGADIAVMGPADFVAAEELGFMFVPTEIRRPCGRGGSRGGGDGSGWRYEMKVRPIGEGIRILAEAAAGVKGATMPAPHPAPCSTEAAERYDSALAAVAKKVLSEGRASLRMSLIETEYPALVREYKRKTQQLKTPTKKGKPKSKATGTAEGEGKPGTTLLHFFSKDTAASSASSSASASASASSASSAAESADQVVVGTPLAAAQAAPSLSSCSLIELLDDTPLSPMPEAAAAERGAPAAFSTPVDPTRPSLRTPGAPAKPKRAISPWPVDGEEEEDEEEGGFGSGAMQDLNTRFKRARSGDEGGELEGDEQGESSVVEIDLSMTSLSHFAEEAGGGGGGGEGGQTEDDEVEIIGELPRAGAGTAAGGRRREAVDVVDLTTP